MGEGRVFQSCSVTLYNLVGNIKLQIFIEQELVTKMVMVFQYAWYFVQKIQCDLLEIEWGVWWLATGSLATLHTQGFKGLKN